MASDERSPDGLCLLDTIGDTDRRPGREEVMEIETDDPVSLGNVEKLALGIETVPA